MTALAPQRIHPAWWIGRGKALIGVGGTTIGTLKPPFTSAPQKGPTGFGVSLKPRVILYGEELGLVTEVSL